MLDLMLVSYFWQERQMKICGTLAILSAFLLGGCASSSVMQLDSNTVQITTSAAPVCGSQGAQQVAQKRAAYETLKRGFDRYMIVGAQAKSNVGVVDRRAHV